MFNFGDLPKKIVGNTLAQLAGKAITVITTLLITMLTTRRFGAAGYGELSLMLAYPTFFYMAADFGFNAIFAKRVSGGEGEDIRREFKTLLTLRFFWSLFLILLASLILKFFPYDKYLKLGILLGLLTILNQALLTTANAVFQVKLSYLKSTVAVGLGSILSLVWVLLCTLIRTPLVFIVLGYVVGGIFTAAISLFFARKEISLTKLLPSFAESHGFCPWRNEWKDFFIPAIPLGLTAFLSVTVGKADSIILSLLKTTREVGLYGLSYKIFEVSLVFPTFFMNALYPVLLKRRSESEKAFSKGVRKALIFLFPVGILGAILGIFFSPFLVKIVGGTGFDGSTNALKLLFLGLPVFYTTALLFWVIIVLDEQRKLPFIYGFAALFNIVMNIILIPKYSFYGSAVLTWVTEILILVACLLVIWRSSRKVF